MNSTNDKLSYGFVAKTLHWTYRQFDGLADPLHREIFGQRLIPILIGVHVEPLRTTTRFASDLSFCL